MLIVRVLSTFSKSLYYIVTIVCILLLLFLIIGLIYWISLSLIIHLCLPLLVINLNLYYLYMICYCIALLPLALSIRNLLGEMLFCFLISIKYLLLLIIKGIQYISIQLINKQFSKILR